MNTPTIPEEVVEPTMDKHDERAREIMDAHYANLNAIRPVAPLVQTIAAALRLSASEAAPVWQDIATAPRDGRAVIVRLGNGEVFRAAFVEGQWLAASDIGCVNAQHWMPYPAIATAIEKEPGNAT